MELNSAPETVVGDIWEELSACVELPTPPGIAIKLVDLAQSTDTNFAQVEELVRLDPAISAKLLRLANSSFYARNRKIENLRQAIGQFGLNGTLIIALTFSLIKIPKNSEPNLDHNRYWLRSLAAAIICKRLSQLCSAGSAETFYLAGLLQDIGILAIDAIRPVIYSDTSTVANSHTFQLSAERAALGLDHSDVGGWLLEQWQFPTVYSDVTRASHTLDENESPAEIPLLSTCVAVSSHLSELWSLPYVEFPEKLISAVTDTLQISEASLHTLLAESQKEINEVVQLFDLSEISEAAITTLMSEAKECLTLRSLVTNDMFKQTNTRLVGLEKRTAQLERKLDYDDLTAVHTRSYGYAILDQEFPRSTELEQPMSLVFVDLDDFKKINDQYGHSVGDKVLKLAANTLKEVARKEDIVARVGGEEFLIVMLNTGYARASELCECLVSCMSDKNISIDSDIKINVTASIGLAIHAEQTHYDNVHHLIENADVACYKAKTSGKNRWVAATS